ncbi:MAG: BTAD domain-containing putative transcriptional regulator [Candidatus Promineifilaceae bacterium]|nr:BTAD domain-containing putative transcriptional regulator [Candidatus Promineifilaceae bacterium]
MPDLRLSLLGSPLVELDGVLIEIGKQKALALLGYLAVTGEVQARSSVATMLWPENEQGRGRAYLRHALWSLRQAGLGGWLDAERQTVALRAGYELDVAEFDRSLDRCRQHPHTADDVCQRCVDPLRRALVLYRDDFMAGFTLPDTPSFDDWQRFEAERLQVNLASVLARLVSWHEHAGEFERAIEYGRRALALDPLREEVHLRLMMLYARAGHHALAMRQYETCVTTLREELDVRPSNETVALAEQIRSRKVVPGAAHVGRDDFRAEFVARLPPQQTTFVGREQELAELLGLLETTRSRLITIVGPGGMGKTRLALAVAERLQVPALAGGAAAYFRYPDGIIFVDRAPLNQAEHVAEAIATALNLQPVTGPDTRSPRQWLLDYLSRKQLLLILDNLEHLRGATELLPEILVAAPKIQVIVTSRQRLDLVEEQLFPLQGLPFPSQAQLQDIDGREALRFPAVQLLQQSVRRVLPGYEISEDDLTAVVRICQIVEGMPLALELAASWAETLSLPAIADEIGRGFDMLESDRRNVPERHRSLRAVFDATWQRLLPEQRQIFAQLSVFRGGFTHTAAGAVTDPATTPLRAKELASTSLLQFDPVGNRFRLHEMLRQYAAEKLVTEARAVTGVRRRHARFYAERLRNLKTDLEGAAQLEALREIELEKDNIRGAWNWCVSHHDWQQLDNAMEGLGRFYRWSGRFQEGESAFADAAAEITAREDASSDDTDSRSPERRAVLAGLMVWQAVFKRLLGELGDARAQFQRCLELLDEAEKVGIDIRHKRAHALLEAGFTAILLGEYEEAQKLGRQSLTHYRERGDKWGRAAALEVQCWALWYLGDREAARRYGEESLRLRQTIGDKRGIADTLTKLSFIAQEQLRLGDARRYSERAVELYRQLDDRSNIVYGIYIVGTTWLCAGNFNRAHSLIGQALERARDLLAYQYVPRLTAMLAYVDVHRGHYDQAAKLAERALALSQNAGDQRSLGIAFYSLGLVALARRQYEEAHSRLGKSANVLRSTRDWSLLAMVLAARARAASGFDDWQTAQEHLLEALRMALEKQSAQALQEALFIAVILMLRADVWLDEMATFFQTVRNQSYVHNSSWLRDMSGGQFEAAAAFEEDEPQHAAQSSIQLSELRRSARWVVAELSLADWSRLPNR